MLSNKRIEAIRLACRAHALQTYDGKPYDFHLDMVEKVLLGHDPDAPEHLRIGCWLHDTIEDSYVSSGMIKRGFGQDIARMTILVTDFRGEYRSERKPDEYYDKLATNRDAVIVKLCDRIANVFNSLATKYKMGDTYEKEYARFREKLFSVDGSELELSLWATLDTLTYDGHIGNVWDMINGETALDESE